MRHIAFIMDGNRRWATEQGERPIFGHTQGLETFKTIVKHCHERGISHVTFWALSTENLQKRSSTELEHLFKLLGTLREYLHDLITYNARIQYIGDLTKLPAWLRAVLRDVAHKTKDHTGMVVTLGVNYGGHDELIRMGKQLVKVAKSSSQVSDKTINKIIDSGTLPPVDMIIRTGGHKRLSGFLPWIADYAELYFVDTYWPAFTTDDLDEALAWFEGQERNFGK